MFGRSVDFSGGGSQSTGGKEDKKALLERARMEREMRARNQLHGARAIVIQRCVRRFLARCRAQHALRGAYDARWTTHTSAMNRRLAAGRDGSLPTFDASLFPAEGPRLVQLISALALLNRSMERTRLQRSRPPSQAAQAVLAGDDMRLLSLCAAVVKAAADKSPGAERHSLFGAALEAPMHAAPSAASSSSAATFTAHSFWLRSCELLVGMLLTRLLRDSATGAPREPKHFGLLAGALCTLLDPLRWNLPGEGTAAASPASPSSPTAAAAALSPPVLLSFRSLLQRLLAKQQPFLQLRQLLLQLCFPAAPQAASFSAASSSAASAAGASLPQRPLPFIQALLGACFRIVEIACCTPLPASVSRSLPHRSAFLIAEPAYLFATHILSIPACHTFFTPQQLAALTPSSVGAAAAASSASALSSPAASSSSPRGASLYDVLYSALHQLLLPAHFQSGGYFLVQAPPPVFLSPEAWAVLQEHLPQWARYEAVQDASSANVSAADVLFNMPASVHLLATLCWLSLRVAPLSKLLSLQKHEFMVVSASLLHVMPLSLLGVADSGRLDLDDDEPAYHLLRGPADNGADALLVRREFVNSVEVLFRQQTLALVLNPIFLEGHALLEEQSESSRPGLSAVAFAAKLKSFALLDTLPEDAQVFMQAFRTFTAHSPSYFSALLTLLKVLQSIRMGSAQSGHHSSRLVRNNGLSSLTFSTPFLNCLWAEMQQRIGCPLSEEGTMETQVDYSSSGTNGSSSATDALRSFFGFKPSAGGSQPGTQRVLVTHRNRWELAILTSRDGVPSGSAGGEAVSTDLFLLWLSFYSPLLFVLEDDELLQKLPSFPARSDGGGVHTLVSLVHLLKMLCFRLIFAKYEDADTRQVDFPKYADLLSPAQMLLRELYQRDVRRAFMHLGALPSADAGAAAAEQRTQHRGSYAPISDMDASASAAAAAASSASAVPADEDALEDAASLDRKSAHWLLSSGGGLASRNEMARFERDFDAWTQSNDDGAQQAQAEVFDPDSPHAQRLFQLIHAMPFILPFRKRVSLLRNFIKVEGLRLGYLPGAQQRLAPYEIVVRRENAVADGLAGIARLGRLFRHRVRVTFIDGQTGEAERGIDLGGPTKELLSLIAQEVFKVDYGLFTRTAAGKYYPSPSAPFIHGDACGPLLRSAGRVLGKALFENILLDIPLAGFFLARFIGQGVVLADLAEMDPQLHKSLMHVKNYPGDVADLCLNFTAGAQEIESSGRGAQGSDVELIPGGADIDVTNANRTNYVYKLAHYHLSLKLAPVLAPFMQGLSEQVNLKWFSLFSTAEMRLLLSGSSARDIDVADWSAYTRYEECSASSGVVRNFWAVVRGMTPDEKRKLLKFVTSCARPPLQGFRELNPPFTIRALPTSEGSRGLLASLFSSKPSTAQLPSAATCFNMLKLPSYSSKSVLAEKLRLAIESNTGFHLA